MLTKTFEDDTRARAFASSSSFQYFDDLTTTYNGVIMEDLPDSTDWINTPLSFFEPLEAAMRCQVCKEFYDTPMITTCSHTFCSLCIRRCLTSDGKCPACKKDDQADKLKRNWVVQEIVERFQAARPTALELARQAVSEDQTIRSSSSLRKRKRVDAQTRNEESERPSRRTRNSQKREQVGTSPPQHEFFEDDNDDNDEYVLESGMVKCPMCGKKMKEEAVYFHLDNCQGPENGRSTRSRWTSSKLNPPLSLPPQKNPSPAAATRLPQLNYSILNDKALRKKLQDLEIPAWGSKQLLVRRHTEWVNLWNSNCDSTSPKSKQKLLKELDIWEKSQGGDARIVESKFMKKDFDGTGWAQGNKDQFDELIANARKKRAVGRDEDVNKQAEKGRERQNEENGKLSKEVRPSSTVDDESCPSSTVIRPYEGNEEALSIIREKVEQANQTGYPTRSLSREVSALSTFSKESDEKATPASNRDQRTPTLIPNNSSSQLSPPLSSTSSSVPKNPFSEPMRKVPMFQVPEEPICDVDTSANVQ